MAENPLKVPQDRRVWDIFSAHFRLHRDVPPLTRLRELVTAFAQLPYENLTKILKADECGSPERSRRHPAEVVADHLAYGAGGTCFSLTATLLHLVRSLGWRAEPLLADRRYGENTHCALLVWLEGQPHLIDPGFLILDPIPLDTSQEVRVPTAFNELVLSPRSDERRLELSTISQGRRTYRLTFKTSPAEESEFLGAWDASFDWDMMHYPVLTRMDGGRQLYLQGGRFQTRSLAGVERMEVPPGEATRRITAAFGLDPRLVARALATLRRHGDDYG
jgi:arylamine N-acetyltransferase